MHGPNRVIEESKISWSILTNESEIRLNFPGSNKLNNRR